MSERRIVNLTLDTLEDLPVRCRQCVFWELDPLGAERATDLAFEKEAWVSATLLQWGSCGRVAYIGDVPAGYALFAPASYVPRAGALPTRPVAPDALLLATLFVRPEFAGEGLGRALVQAVAKEAAKRGFKAVEAFGEERWQGPQHVIPADFLRCVGFKTVRAHHRYPRLRLEVPRTIGWREEVEYALDQLLDSMKPTLARAS